ncbi:MAG: hypothetical protein HYV02_08495 [Deltaproteobacteria bacterium]|nr:hypothetical protein [Deltaproteobacteria bacterium]
MSITRAGLFRGIARPLVSGTRAMRSAAVASAATPTAIPLVSSRRTFFREAAGVVGSAVLVGACAPHTRFQLTRIRQTPLIQAGPGASPQFVRAVLSAYYALPAKVRAHLESDRYHYQFFIVHSLSSNGEDALAGVAGLHIPSNIVVVEAPTMRDGTTHSGGHSPRRKLQHEVAHAVDWIYRRNGYDDLSSTPGFAAAVAADLAFHRQAGSFWGVMEVFRHLGFSSQEPLSSKRSLAEIFAMILSAKIAPDPDQFETAMLRSFPNAYRFIDYTVLWM